ncbi:MAG: DNA-binding protein, partial [Candidatus Omnitrophica bacterium]|nr:DNA-binding protein [Candidatus Omnitrophota bacterium]
MRKNFLFQTACTLVIILFCIPSHAQTISSTELIKDAKQHDGKNVTFQGEVVGDIMIRGEHAWLSVNDGPNAIGIWIDKELIDDIQYVGSYGKKGDIVEVAGV